MSVLYLKDISFRYHSASLVLNRVHLQFPRGWSGVVGENGCGKSTLLRLISGALMPDSGLIIRDPPGMRVHYCAQELIEYDAEITNFAWNFEKEACRLKQELQLDEEQISRWNSLSPGERKRWQIGAALCSGADILLLDEPGNHIDSATEVLLLNALKHFPGIGILVSHHRKWLDTLTKQTVWLASGNAESYAKPYTQAKELRDANKLNLEKQRNAEKQQIKNLSQQLSQAKERSVSAERSKKNLRKPGDSDSRTIGAKNRVDWALARHSRDVSALEHKRERAFENLPPASERELGSRIFLEYAPCPRETLLTLQNLTIQAGEKICFHAENFKISRTDKIHLKGVNGSGKSTFLRYLTDFVSIPREKILYLPQEYSREETAAILQEVRLLPPKVKGKFFILLAALGCSPQAVELSEELSPGEIRKLHIALGLERQVQFLILDEPTNHLDLPSVERLEKALSLFPGAILLVSHDGIFAENCTQKTFVIEDMRLKEVWRDSSSRNETTGFLRKNPGRVHMI